MAEAEHTPLRRINRKALSLVRYEACLEAGGPAPVYAWPWFLDVMAGAWEALVWDDYRYVMPVAHRRKWGISYVYQPMFAQQLGIYPSPPPGWPAHFMNSWPPAILISAIPRQQAPNRPQRLAFRSPRFTHAPCPSILAMPPLRHTTTTISHKT